MKRGTERRHSLGLVFAALLVLALSLLGAGCKDSPDFERIRDKTRPEAVLYTWFSSKAIDEQVVSRDVGSFIDPCRAIVDSPGFQLNNEQAEEAFRAACARWQDIYEKYPDIIAFREWISSNPFVRPPWNGPQTISDSPRDECCEQLAHLLMWEDFSAEIEDMSIELRDDLVCGSGNEYVYDEDSHCRKRGSGPILASTFDEAVSAIKAFLHYSATYSSRRCQSQPCEREISDEIKRNENLIMHAVSSGHFEPLVSSYTPRGEWRILLISSWPESDEELLQCFEVLNEPGKYEVRKLTSEDGVGKEVTEAGHPRVNYCGGFSHMGQGYARTNGSFQVTRMSD